MAITNASRLADFGSGIGTAGAVLEVDNANKRIGLGTTNPNTTVQVGAVGASGTSLFVHADARILGVITATKFSGGWDGSFSVTDTTASTSSSTGALIVSGGVGIAKSLFVAEGISVGGTITYDDVTNVDSVGIVTAGKGFRATTGGIIVSAGVGTFKADVELHGNQGVSSVTWDSSANSLIFKDRSEVKFGSGNDLRIMHDGTNPYMDQLGSPQGAFYIRNNDAQFIFQAKMDENSLILKPDGAVELYHDNAKKLETGSAGVTVTGNIYTDGNVNLTVDDKKIRFGAGEDLQLYHDGTNSHVQNTTGNLLINQSGVGVSMYGDLKLQNGLLRESVNIVANKISAAPTINTDNGMMHYFTTQETTTTKPNIISSAGINTDMAIGDTMCLTVITTAAAGGYSFDWRVDGVEASAGVTSSWVGGSAPSAGGSSGLDTYSLTFIKTASARYTMIGNLINSA